MIRLVHGPPGTGKTRYLADQCALAAARHGQTRVAIVSLTRTAAAEIADRTRLPDENVGTLHAHCYRALDRPPLAETPEALRAFNAMHPDYTLTGGARALEDATTVNTEHADDTIAHGDQLHATTSIHRARRTPADEWTDDQRAFHHIWTGWKTATGRQDFTDLIETCLREHTYHPVVPAVLLVDEAQDFSALELALITKWAAGTDLTIIAGDADQALYTWRGSDPGALLDLPVDEEHVLEQSHRVPAAVHGAATSWIRGVQARRPVNYRPTDRPGLVDQHPYALNNSDQLLQHLEHDLARGQTTMVLASCSYMLKPVVDLLRQHAVPFHNRYRVQQGAWNPLRAANRLLAYLAPTDDMGDQARPWTWDDLRLFTDPIKAAGTMHRGAKSVIEGQCQADQFGATRANDTVTLDDLAHLFLGIEHGHPLLRMDVDWYQSVLLASHQKTLSYPIAVYKTRGLKALLLPVDDAGDVTNEAPVTVGTIHSVKGGQADHVYLAPDLSRAGMWDSWFPGGDSRDSIIRMFYVALTRARHHVTVLAPVGPEHVPVDQLLAGAHLEAIAA